MGKKILLVMLTSVFTVLLMLFALWMLDIVELKGGSKVQSTPIVQKSNKLEAENTLAELLNVEYPRLGDDIQQAYDLFGEPKFASEGELDFYLLDKKKIFYISFDEAGGSNRIESITFYVKGDKEKVKELGEKVLPVNSTFFNEVENVEEDRNETFRYTSTDYHTTSYYKTTDSMNRYAFIKISHDESDLFEESDIPDSLPTYRLVVSYPSQIELKEIGEKTEIEQANEKETIKVDMSQSFDEIQADTQPSESNNQSNEGSYGTNFSEEAIGFNNERVLRSDFLELASKGETKGIHTSIGSAIGPVIEAYLGQPDWRDEAEGGFTLMYRECQCGLGVGYDYEEYPETPISSFVFPITLSYDQIITYLGQPDEEGYSEVDTGYYLFYNLGEHQLFIESNEPQFDGVLEWVVVR
ncbi:hypothetical protein [Bacillus weihaiensis]|uniref:hypothetical protein n=1 Tax=Bacillus weihaiensis TaxID=1547283 RepID=UPI0023521647|nr:hypothetical protein [Bacillus weihaiensis]